jgi:hypothetical protein
MYRVAAWAEEERAIAAHSATLAQPIHAVFFWAVFFLTLLFPLVGIILRS